MSGNKYILFVLFILNFHNLSGQIESPHGKISDLTSDNWYNIDIDPNILDGMRGAAISKNVPFRFAIPVAVELGPENSGTFFHGQDEDIWVLPVRSKGARSLNIILEPFNIPEGAYFFLYNSDRSVIRGAFGSENNNTSGILPTIPVPGEEIILEYHVPSGSYSPGTIGVSQVSHDFAGLFGTDGKDGRFNLSQSCNIDINCSDGTSYDNQKRSVCRIIINGIELCTGVLLNNTNQQNRALTLTAEHCIPDETAASRSLFVFGYESPWCDGPDGRVIHAVSGSVLRSVNEDVDFSLVELSTFPPITYKPYLAGWDVTGLIPTGSVTIHHPKGDVKKISVDNNPPVTSTYEGLVTNGYWKVLQWEKGTTEGGSSGGPLFDQNKRVVGILTGGEAICGRSVNDYFAKTSTMYDQSPYLWRQLKGWIDPAISGLKKLEGRDPYSNNYQTVDTLYNIAGPEVLASIPYSSPGTGYLAGFNSDSIVMYAEHFTSPPGRHIVELLVDLSKVSFIATTDSVRFYLMADGTQPGAVIASQRIFHSEAKDNFQLKVDFKNPVSISTGFYIAWRIWYKNEASAETRQFAVYHSADRSNPAMNTAWFNDGVSWKKFTQHPLIPLSTSLSVKVITVGNSVADKTSAAQIRESSFTVFPNPASDILYVRGSGAGAEVTVTISDSYGRKIAQRIIRQWNEEITEFETSALKPGIYFIRIESGSKVESHKVMISGR